MRPSISDAQSFGNKLSLTLRTNNRDSDDGVKIDQHFVIGQNAKLLPAEPLLCAAVAITAAEPLPKLLMHSSCP
jgi:hypothetical protein